MVQISIHEYNSIMRDDSTIPNFVAEISANHLGSLSRARKLVAAAARAGATSIKFQTYTPETMTLNLSKFNVSENHELWGGRTLYSLYAEAMTPWEWHEELFDLAHSMGLIPFSSPFDISAVNFLESINCPMYKIASLETGDLNLIRAIAGTGKPIIMSTGASTIAEIDDAVHEINQSGNKDLTLLLCTSSYPAIPSDAHLNRIGFLKERYGCKVGLSDHTLGIGVSVAAIALGAVVIEKHLTLKRSDGGADGAFSMEPEEFADLTIEATAAFQALGIEQWSIQDSESESRKLRRSLYIVKNVKKGEIISEHNLKCIRPGGGLPGKYYFELIGKTFNSDFEIGTPMKIEFANHTYDENF